MQIRMKYVRVTLNMLYRVGSRHKKMRILRDKLAACNLKSCLGKYSNIVCTIKNSLLRANMTIISKFSKDFSSNKTIYIYF